MVHSPSGRWAWCPGHPNEGRRVLGESTSAAKEQAAEAQRTFFRVTDNVPEEAWYWAALGSIGVSAALKLSGKDDWAIFVGQWPPTFLLFGVFSRLLRPGSR